MARPTHTLIELFFISVSKNKKNRKYIQSFIFYIFGLVQYTLCNIFLFVLKDMVFHAANMSNFSPKRKKRKKEKNCSIN